MASTERRKALIVGINKYHKAELHSCERDATDIHRLLKEHEDKTANFDAHIHLNPTCQQLRSAVERLLQPERAPDHALFYFSGHGYVDSSGGYLVGKDYKKEDIGVSMEWLAGCIRKSSIKEITLIFDCCYAGVFGKAESEGRPLSHLPENVTLLAASTADDVSSEGPRHGTFTKILIQGLEDAASDVLGRVTAANLYSLADSILTPWQQRPVFKSYVTAMSSLRQCYPTINKELLKELDSYDFFKERNRKKQLQPRDLCTDPQKEKSVARFARLTAFQRARLIQCTDGRTVYEAALHGKTCELTPLGHFFLELLDKNRI